MGEMSVIKPSETKGYTIIIRKITNNTTNAMGIITDFISSPLALGECFTAWRILGKIKTIIPSSNSADPICIQSILNTSQKSPV
jgi:hypothetical protein